MRILPILLAAAAVVALPAVSSGQDAPRRTETVTYANPDDGMVLSAVLTLPAGPGPFLGAVLLSLAGVDPLVDRLVGLGYAVLLAERRGMRTVDHMLDASYRDLANDVHAAQAYLRSRPEVDSAAVGLIGQGDDVPAALLAAAGSPLPAFVVLLSVEGLPGVETFREEQRALAELQGYRPPELDALEAYMDGLAEIVLSEPAQDTRAFRLEALITRSDVGLPRHAALPATIEGQVRFLASPLWRDRLAFEPRPLLEGVRPPVLVLMGVEDPFTDFREHLPILRASLAAAPAEDVLVCLLPGRVRHSFSPEALALIGDWLAPRPADRNVAAACLDEDEVRL